MARRLHSWRGGARARLATVLLAALGVLAGATVGLAAVGGRLGAVGANEKGGSTEWGFRVAGTLAGPLAPGVTTRLDLRVTNYHTFPLSIRALTIELLVDRRHADAGCVRRRDFTVSSVPRTALPVTIGPRRTRTLRALGVRRLPTVRMRDLPVDQDACKGATLMLRFAGRALQAPVTPAPGDRRPG